MSPKRIQRKRTKGWRMPAGAVYVGRPTRWGNPYSVGSNMSTVFVHDGYRVRWSTPRSDEASHAALRKAVSLYRRWLFTVGRSADLVPLLRGRDLACWCPLDEPCHADVLLGLANAKEPSNA